MQGQTSVVQECQPVWIFEHRPLQIQVKLYGEGDDHYILAAVVMVPIKTIMGVITTVTAFGTSGQFWSASPHLSGEQKW